MAEPFLGEIRICSFGFAPRGWAKCDGQLLLIAQNSALFAILGTTFGGDGITTFALPDFRERFPMHTSGTHNLGETGGEKSHVLTSAELPAHTHPVAASGAAASASGAAGALWAASSARDGIYASAADTTLNPATVLAAGSGADHENLPPYLALNFIIAIQGIFPSRN